MKLVKKNIMRLIYILVVGCLGIAGCLWGITSVVKYKNSVSAFRDSEFERGAMFAVKWHHKYKEYPSFYDRENAYRNPKLSVEEIYYKVVDSVTYDSNTHVLAMKYRDDSVSLYNVEVCYWPQIDWNWFKKGYVPEPEINFYQTWLSGDPLRLSEDTTIYVLSVNGEQGKYIPTFRDTINNSK